MAKTEKKPKKAGVKPSNATSVVSSKQVLAKAAAALAKSAPEPSSSSEETSDSDESVEDKKMVQDDASDSSSSEESSESSDEESTTKKSSGPVQTVSIQKEKKSDSEDDSSDASSTSEESNEDEGDENDKPSRPVQTASAEANKKRKADSEAVVPPKKTKLANGNASAATSEGETRSIFVGRLSWNVDNDWLAQEFAECGEVESAHVQMDRDSGRSRGFGYVHFKSADAVEKALELNGKEIDGRAVNIDKSNPRDKGSAAEKRAQAFGDTSSPPTATLFVGNLSFGVDEDTLWETFGEHGDIKSVRVPTDRDTGKPKGFAYVEFSEMEAAKTAHGALQGFELDGRSLRLDFSQPRDGPGGGRGGGQGGRGGRGRGGFGGDRGHGGGGSWGGPSRGGRGGRGGDRGGRGGDRGGRGRGRGARTGGITKFEGQKITFN